ncbi:ABC transporter substrate-binding protein [Eubacterium oxidoreducens]|uniref:Branched-chain amino acid transport system substrate-binding protein n=1 Tax=Eubacterium oxidoreducens TaxID=1732 RepID=A0A1G6A5E7_EUBOX|nr:ABC transporter substrate-binding protein [Eubacterium oxidoreducens]SDB03681.1 branched-chain amino acid transport system substrate-binding protein [Eubacterium oxidoreducens]
MVYSRKKRLTQSMIIVCLLFLLGIAALHSSRLSTNFANEILEDANGYVPIVFLCPQSGYYSYVGNDAAWAAQYAVDKLNEQGGINGNQIRLIIKDTESDPTLVLRYFQGASSVTPVVLGPVDAPESAIIADYLGTVKTTSIASYSYSEIRSLTSSYGISFMSDSENGELASVTNWIEDHPDIKRVVIFSNKGDDSKSETVTKLQKLLPELDVSAVDVIDISGERTNRLYQKTAIRALNAGVDGYISLLSDYDYSNILKELRLRGVTDGGTICASFSSFSAALLEDAGTSLDGTYIWSKYDYSYSGENWQKLVATYQQEHNGELPLRNVISDVYDSVLAIATCYRDLQIDGTLADASTRKAVKEWFYNSDVIHGIQGDFYWSQGEKIADYHYFIFDGATPTTIP